MLTYNDIEKARAAYFGSVDVVGLKRHCEQMKRVLAGSWADKSTKKYAAAFMYKTACKSLMLVYFGSGVYREEDFNVLKTFVESSVPDAERVGLPDTCRVLGNCLAFAEKVNAVMKDVAEVSARVHDDGWKCVARSAEECKEAAAVFEEKIATLTEDDEEGSLFGKGVVCPDFVDEAVEYLRREMEFARAHADEFEDKSLRKILREKVVFEDDERKKGWEVTQSAGALYGGLASVHVLCTPFTDELKLFVAAHTDDGSVRLASASAADLLTSSSADRDKLADALVKMRVDLIVTGITAYLTEEGMEPVIGMLLGIGRKGRKVYVMDTSGARPVYDAFVEAARKSGAATDVDFAYLGMPKYTSVIKRLQESEIIGMSAEDTEFVRKKLPFMGYVGFNAILSSRSDSWRETAQEHSDKNVSAANKYIPSLPDQELFIDDDWGDYSKNIAAVESQRLCFDYDDIPMFNEANIRKITESTAIGVIAKCGLISEYCLLRGADRSTWETLSREEMSERVTEATRLVLRTLGIIKKPVVEVLDKLDTKGAGGICYNGGERIVYLYRCVKNYDWMRGAVCHECFHALQHKAMYGGWFDWLMREFGVTRGRVKQWRVNSLGDEDGGIRGKYFQIDTNKTAYLVQIFESDARAFEFDCAEAANAVRHTIDFE